MIATLTRQDYDDVFEVERQVSYPVIDALEQRFGYALDRERLESAARVLACPVKANPPNWQHGRVLYAVARKYLAGCWIDDPLYANPARREPVQILDVGSAKGFSALVLEWARIDADVFGQVDSVDVIDPLSREYRNSVLESDGPKRLADYLRQWPEASGIRFYKQTGVDWLSRRGDRVHLAFIDGKHTGDVVAKETTLLAGRQEPDDVVVFDDVHIPDVWQAVHGMRHAYEIERIDVLPKRAYAIGVRK